MKKSVPDSRSCARHERTAYFHKNIMNGVEIKQCKGNPHDFKTHVHAELSIGYILFGSTDLCMSDRTIHFGAGDGVIIPPLVSHRCSPQDIRRWEYIMMYIHPDRYEDIVCFPQPRKIEGPAVHRLIGYATRLLAEQASDVLETTVLELLLELGDSIMPDSPDMGIIEQVRDYIAGHVYDTVTLEQLERLTGLNKFTLIRNFKKAYITTPASFHLQCRVAEAKQQMNRGCDVLTLCDELHFFDQAHFIREFRRMYGITPSAYVKQLHA